VSGRRTPAQKSGVKKPRGSNRRRPTQAQSIERQLKIVADREGEHLTFAEIAQKRGMGEKEAREAYWRHVREIAPLMTSVTPDERALVIATSARR
jgi:lipopolysaccharide biosynthesis protein